MPLIDDFKARFPEISASVVDERLPILEGAWPCYYGGSYENKCGREIILQLLAHLLTMSGQSKKGGAVRDVQSKSVGNVSTSYAQGSTANSTTDFFRTTIYGQNYLKLTASNIRGYVV